MSNVAYRYGLAAAFLTVLLASPGAAAEAAATAAAPDSAAADSAAPAAASPDSELPPGALPRPAPELAGPPPRPEGFTTAHEPQSAYDLFAMPEDRKSVV